MTRITIITFAIFLSGCAVQSSHLFDQRKSTLSDGEVCRSYLHGLEHDDFGLMRNAQIEAINRGFDVSSCKNKVQNENVKIIAVAALTTAVAIAAKNSGKGNAPATPSQPIDFEWDWDQFYNEDRQLVWACRGVQTGQFSTLDKCTFKTKTDYRWPEK